MVVTFAAPDRAYGQRQVKKLGVPIMDASIADLLHLPPSFAPGTYSVPLAVVLTLACMYAATLWRGALRAAHWLEQTPRPINFPRRRVLDGCTVRMPARLGLLAMLRAEFHAVAAANPTRRIEDKTAFLRRVATRSLVLAIALAAVAGAVLLAA
jgi:hypothetical protein